ncbi:allantoate deiminase 2 [Tanacetum coccineum]
MFHVVSGFYAHDCSCFQYKFALSWNLNDNVRFAIYVEDYIHSDRGNMEPGKRVKAVGLKSARIKSARKAREISPAKKARKLYPKLLIWVGAKGDSTKITTPDIVEEQQVTQNWPFRVVLGLQCKAVTLLQSKKAETPIYIIVAVTNETGDAIPSAVNGDNTLNQGAETELALPHDAFKTVKGKKGKRRSIISLETEAAPQAVYRRYLQATLIGNGAKDTVVDAGLFDGALGVISVISALKMLNVIERLRHLKHPVEVITFCDEEGVRFQSTFLGSTAIAGVFPVSTLRVPDKRHALFSSLTVQNVLKDVQNVLKENLIDTTKENLSQLKYKVDSVLGYVEIKI